MFMQSYPQLFNGAVAKFHMGLEDWPFTTDVLHKKHHLLLDVRKPEEN